MTKREREKLKKIVNELHDNFPYLELLETEKTEDDHPFKKAFNKLVDFVFKPESKE